MEVSSDTSWRGNCYMNAITLVLNYDESEFMLDKEELQIVHGLVDGNGPLKGHVICHGWVEDELHCYDHDGRTNKVAQIPKPLYYAMGNIKTVRRYEPREVYNLVSEYSHSGPWDLDLQKHAETEYNSVWEKPDE